MTKKPLPRKPTWNKFWDLQLSPEKFKGYLNNFSKSKKIGESGEKFIFNIFSNKKIKVECKTDLRCSTSNNLAIEIESRGLPSGLTTTRADVWMFLVGKGAIITIPVYVLKKICKKLIKESPYYLKSVGDHDKKTGKHTSKIVLLPISKLVRLVEENS